MTVETLVGVWLVAGGCLVAAGTVCLVAIGLALDARRTRDESAVGCRRDACRQGCAKRGGDGPPLRLFDDGTMDAYVRGDVPWSEIRTHYQWDSR